MLEGSAASLQVCHSFWVFGDLWVLRKKTGTYCGGLLGGVEAVDVIREKWQAGPLLLRLHAGFLHFSRNTFPYLPSSTALRVLKLTNLSLVCFLLYSSISNLAKVNKLSFRNCVDQWTILMISVKSKKVAPFPITVGNEDPGGVMSSQTWF